jgi:CBS domain-containing protein
MRVSDGMSALVLVIGPGHTLRQAAGLMAARGCGAAVVLDAADGAGYGILTERDLLLALAAGKDPDVEIAADHLTRDLVFADPDWSLDTAADAMLRGGFRHLIVTEGGNVAGVLSMRDVVRCWNQQRVHA